MASTKLMVLRMLTSHFGDYGYLYQGEIIEIEEADARYFLNLKFAVEATKEEAIKFRKETAEAAAREEGKHFRTASVNPEPPPAREDCIAQRERS